MSLRDAVRFVPDCLVLLRRLATDRRVSRWRRLMVLALIPYLASPIDLIPDFIPVIGYLDDVAIVALVLRGVVKGAGPAVLEEHWPGTPEDLATLRHTLRIAA